MRIDIQQTTEADWLDLKKIRIESLMESPKAFGLTYEAELSDRARQLPPQERAQLAEGLLESLQEWSSPEVEAAWDVEILKRIGEYQRGEAMLSPAANVFAEARRLTQ